MTVVFLLLFIYLFSSCFLFIYLFNCIKLMVFSYQSKTRQPQDNHKTNVEPVHSYDAFHTGLATTGAKGIIGMHMFNICLVLSLSCRCLALV